MSAQRSTDVLDDHAAIEPRLAAEHDRTLQDVEVVDFVAEIQNLHARTRARVHGLAHTLTTHAHMNDGKMCVCVSPPDARLTE